MTTNKQQDSIEKEILEIETDLEKLRRSISLYDESKQGTKASNHIEDLLSSLREIEKDIQDLPTVIRDISDIKETKK